MIQVLQQVSILEFFIYFLLPTWRWQPLHFFGIEPVEQMPDITLRRALYRGKCPRCREGDIFKYPLIRIHKFSKMHESCPNCGASFEPEPGFYYGAMFVSYAFSVALLTIVSLALYFLWNPKDWIYVLVITLATLLSTPASFRYSRILFLFAFGGYRYRPNTG